MIVDLYAGMGILIYTRKRMAPDTRPMQAGGFIREQV